MLTTTRSPLIPLIALLVLVLGPTGCSTMHEKKPRDVMKHRHEPGGPVRVTTPAEQRLYEFHGHVGPYVVLGFRAGGLAREILESPGYFDLSVTATCPLQTPKSCFLDGLQLGSGCTVGKRNLSFRSGEPIAGLFKSKNGRSVRISLKKGLPDQLRAWIEASGVEETGEKVMNLPVEELFVVERL